MKYRRLLLGGFLALGLAVTAASGALAEQIVAVNSQIESVDGQAAQVTGDTTENAETSTAKPDPASITPTATGISIYISKRQSKLTLMQNKQVIGTWDAKLGRQSATGDKVKEGMKSLHPAVSMYVPEMIRASIIWRWDCLIPILKTRKEACQTVLLPRNSIRQL